MSVNVLSARILRRKLLLRMGLAWLGVSLLFLALVLYSWHEEMDKTVFGLARQELTEIIAGHEALLQNQDPKALAAWEEAVDRSLPNGHFVVVEIYDTNDKQVLESVTDKGHEVEDWMKKTSHAAYLSDKELHQNITINGEDFLQVFLPIFAPNGERLGVFEGIYLVPQESIDEVRKRMFILALEIMAAVLVATLVLYPIVMRMNGGLRQMAQDLAEANVGMLEVLGQAVSKRDSDTSEHNYRVTLYTIRLGEAMGLDHPTMQGLIKGAFLHDVGKIGTTDSILLKPGKLTEEEFEIMKQHVSIGAEILAPYPWLKDARAVVESHHEKVDGSGYLRGLRKDEIPLPARIFAICDVFDALTSKRPYKEPFSLEKSCAILREGRDSHFDPDALDQFLDFAPELFETIRAMESTALRALLRKYVDNYFS